jgi:hypothetical protein
MWSVPDWRTDEMHTLLDNRDSCFRRDCVCAHVVTLKIPIDRLVYENIRIRDSKPIYVATVIKQGGTFINGHAALPESLPSLFEVRMPALPTADAAGSPAQVPPGTVPTLPACPGSEPEALS